MKVVVSAVEQKDNETLWLRQHNTRHSSRQATSVSHQAISRW